MYDTVVNLLSALYLLIMQSDIIYPKSSMLLGYIQKRRLSIYISPKVILHKMFYLLKDRH